MFDQPQDFDRLSAFFYMLSKSTQPDIGAYVTKAEHINLADLRAEATAQIVPREQAELEVPGLEPEQEITFAQLANIRAYRLTGIGAPARTSVSSLTTYGAHGTDPEHPGGPRLAPRAGAEISAVVAEVAERTARAQAEAEA